MDSKKIKVLMLPHRYSSERHSFDRSQASRKCRYPGCRHYGGPDGIDYYIHPWGDRRSLPRLLCETDLNGVFIASNHWIGEICGQDWEPGELFRLGTVFDQKSRVVESHRTIWLRYSVVCDTERIVPEGPRIFCEICDDQLFTSKVEGQLEWTYFRRPAVRIPPIFALGTFEMGVTPDGWSRIKWGSMPGLKVHELSLLDPPKEGGLLIDPNTLPQSQPKARKLP